MTQNFSDARWALMTTALSQLCLAYNHRRAVLAHGTKVALLYANSSELMAQALNDLLSTFETSRARLADLDGALLDLASTPQFRRVAELQLADFECRQARLPLEG